MPDKKPRNLRNFWVEVYIDGQKTRLSGGPKGKHDGMLVVIHMADGDTPKKAITLTCEAEEDSQWEPTDVPLRVTLRTEDEERVIAETFRDA